VGIAKYQVGKRGVTLNINHALKKYIWCKQLRKKRLRGGGHKIGTFLNRENSQASAAEKDRKKGKERTPIDLDNGRQNK